MYSLAKKMITEKDLQRKITILENLISHQTMTTKELAGELSVSQRTIFNDLQTLRFELPEEWQLTADGNEGVALNAKRPAQIHEVWEFFMRDSLTMQLLKALLTKKSVSLTDFCHENGVSAETLKRQLGKLNRELQGVSLQITSRGGLLQWSGAESTIRIFYHRLLLPFTHQHFFFDDYAVHQSNYQSFLRGLPRKKLVVDTEEIFGTCWFFINVIRIKAGCWIGDVDFQADALFLRYQTVLQKLYQSEGIKLAGAEEFFAFFCFLESWNYELTDDVREILSTGYGDLFGAVRDFLQALGLSERMVTDQFLVEDLVLFLVKYHESVSLANQFLLEYAEVLALSKARFGSLLAQVQAYFAEGKLPGIRELSEYAANSLVLLIQAAKARLLEEQYRGYLIYQGEPAWKQFLIQELRDLVGSRVLLVETELRELRGLAFTPGDFIISNHPLGFEAEGVPIIYFSSLPTQRELAELRALIQELYL